MTPLKGHRTAETYRPAGWLILEALVLISLFASPAQPASAQLTGTSNYEVKTAFLFNFAKFVDWPAGSFPSPDSPFSICVLGQDPFGNILDNALQGKMIGERHLAVQRLKDRSEARECQM